MNFMLKECKRILKAGILLFGTAASFESTFASDIQNLPYKTQYSDWQHNDKDHISTRTKTIFFENKEDANNLYKTYPESATHDFLVSNEAQPKKTFEDDATLVWAMCTEVQYRRPDCSVYIFEELGVPQYILNKNDKGIQHLLKSCASFPNLNSVVQIEASYDTIGEPGLVTLSTALSQLPNIVDLDYSCNYMNYETVAALGQLSTVTTLNLGHNNIGDECVEYIKQIETLTTLYLYDNNIGAQGAEHISQMAGLTNLDLNKNKLGDQGVEYIARMDNLITLNVGWNNIKVQGTLHIAQMINLTTLDLSGNKIGVGAHHLKQMINLTKVYLRYVWIGRESTEYLTEALPNTKFFI
jgi:Leucine-rich repeat (LRR) protein